MYYIPPANITSRTQAIAEVLPQMAQEHCDFVHKMNGADEDLKVSEKHVYNMLIAAPLEKVLMFSSAVQLIAEKEDVCIPCYGNEKFVIIIDIGDREIQVLAWQ